MFKKVFTSRVFKTIGSSFASIFSKTGVVYAFFKKISTYPPLSWIKRFAFPIFQYVSKKINTFLNYSIKLLGKLHLGKAKNGLESLQIFFQPEHITGLTFNKNFISAVRVANSFKGTVIEHTAISSVKKPDEMIWELIRFSRSEGLEGNTLVTCLPTSTATVRQIPIPIENIKKLSRIIKYQMEPYVPFSIDDMVIDFLPPNKGDKVLTAGVENRILSEHIESLSQADLEPHIVSLDDIALIPLFHHAGGLDTSLPNAVIHFSEEKTSVMILKDKQLMFIRVLAPNKENPAALKETLNLYQLENPDKKPHHILLTGYPGVDKSFAEKIQSELGIPASVWMPFDYLNHSLGKLDMDAQTRLSVPLGLALSTSNSKTRLFDLRKEAFAIKHYAILKKFLTYTATAAIVFLILFTLSIYQKLFVYSHKNAQLQKELQTVYIKAFPGAKPIKGQELAQMQQKVDEEATYKVLDGIGNGNTVLGSLMALTKVFSDVQGLSIYQLSVEGYDIKLYGSASSFETVDKLKQSLETKDAFQTVKLLDAKMDKKDNVVRFNIDLEKVR